MISHTNLIHWHKIFPLEYQLRLIETRKAAFYNRFDFVPSEHSLIPKIWLEFVSFRSSNFRSNNSSFIWLVVTLLLLMSRVKKSFRATENRKRNFNRCVPTCMDETELLTGDFLICDPRQKWQDAGNISFHKEYFNLKYIIFFLFSFLRCIFHIPQI